MQLHIYHDRINRISITVGPDCTFLVELSNKSLLDWDAVSGYAQTSRNEMDWEGAVVMEKVFLKSLMRRLAIWTSSWENLFNLPSTERVLLIYRSTYLNLKF